MLHIVGKEAKLGEGAGDSLLQGAVLARVEMRRRGKVIEPSRSLPEFFGLRGIAWSYVCVQRSDD
jgi:hypothetical protein